MIKYESAEVLRKDKLDNKRLEEKFNNEILKQSKIKFVDSISDFQSDKNSVLFFISNKDDEIKIQLPMFNDNGIFKSNFSSKSKEDKICAYCKDSKNYIQITSTYEGAIINDPIITIEIL